MSPETPVLHGEVHDLVRGEFRDLLRRNLWRFAGIVICVWLVGAMTSAGFTWYIASTQSEKNAQFESQNQLASYVINRGACAAYSLVDPSIKANKTLIAALTRVIEDPATTSAIVKADRKRRLAIIHLNTVSQNFRNVYGTIPLDYDCTLLPKQPPS